MRYDQLVQLRNQMNLTTSAATGVSHLTNLWEMNIDHIRTEIFVYVVMPLLQLGHHLGIKFQFEK